MLYSIWTAKPGSGGSTTALALAGRLAAKSAREVLLVDLGGDQPAAVGLDNPDTGLTDWLAAASASDEALRRVEVPIARSHVSLLPLGARCQWTVERAAMFHQLLHHESRPVVVDVGTVTEANSSCMSSCMDALRNRFAADEVSLLVTRACYLSLRRAAALTTRPSGVVLIREKGRSLDAHDIEEVLGVAVQGEIDHHPSVARALDSGILARRCPARLSHQMRGLVR